MPKEVEKKRKLDVLKLMGDWNREENEDVERLEMESGVIGNLKKNECTSAHGKLK